MTESEITPYTRGRQVRSSRCPTQFGSNTEKNPSPAYILSNPEDID